MRHTRSLGDQLGLTDLGVHLVRVEPGHDSTQFHFHHQDEEFLYILEGSGIAEIGDEIVHEENVHRAVKDSYLKKTFIQEIKEDFKLFVARFYESRKTSLSSEIEKSLSKNEKLLGKEIRMMKKFNKEK